jgi:hypothetical protein
MNQPWELASASPHSGRKAFLSPAKAGAENKKGQLPGAALRFTSFRFACPGLNSAAGYAGSLNASTLRRFYYTIILASIVCLSFACNRGKSGGISSATGGLPVSSGTPAEVSSSADVVKISALPIQIKPGESADAIVKLSISKGYHVNANPATFPYLIATEVKPVIDPDGFCARTGTATYPAAKTETFAFAEAPLAVYEGDVEVRLPFTIPPQKSSGCYIYPTAGSNGSLPITVRVQACDTEKCFPPATMNATIPIEVQ